MQPGDWDRLTAPFAADAVGWRLQELAPDKRSALLVPHLRAQEVASRLDDVAGRPGWSVRYTPFGNGVICELAIAGVSKSAVVDRLIGAEGEAEGDESLAEAAMARAAELFGLQIPTAFAGERWVDYDPELGTGLLPEDAEVAAPAPSSEDRIGDTESKTAGQQAIDRLVERLKSEGKGLEAARLLVEYGGYGADPEAARELYGRLRELLRRTIETVA